MDFQMKALTAAEMREVDRLSAESFGIPAYELMEAAGKGVAEVFLQEYGRRSTRPLRRVCVLCGKGNNGGDGFVVARHLKEEADHVDVYLFANPEEVRGDAAKNLQRWEDAGGNIVSMTSRQEWEKNWPAIASTDVIVDAMLGTGIRHGATGVIAQAIEDVNRLSKNATAARPRWIVAVDTPSGLPSDGGAAEGPVIRAHLTVTFTAPKIGQLISRDAACCGQIFVRPIGSPKALVEEIGKGGVRWSGPDEFAKLPLVRAWDSHKGKYGNVLLVAGSVGKSGAAVLGGQSALRAGAGLVTIGIAEPILAIVAMGQPEYMTEPLPATPSGTISAESIKSGKFAEIVRGKTVLAVGPGLGTHPQTQEFIRSLVSCVEVPLVLDADGLNAFAGRREELKNRKTKHLVVTPHPGEMSRLLGVSIPEVELDRVKTARDAAQEWNACVLLKGFHTVVASPDGRVFVNTTGTPGLAKGGSGDVLTGLLAGLIGQFGPEDLPLIVALGVYLHGVAAELLTQQSDASGVIAGEVPDAIPYARRKLLEELQDHG
jgi:ADP-dependent NAD(P)H-hydrate dehydratase / NAD(P)H-hydrate epimerase